jgi:hypothetical protein
MSMISSFSANDEIVCLPVREAAEDVVDVSALRFLEPPADQFLGRGVQVLDDQVLVGGDHAVADGPQRDLRGLVELALVLVHGTSYSLRARLTGVADP